MIGDEDAIFDDPPADDAAFNEDAGGDTALAEDPLAVSDHVSMPEADSPDRADAQAEAEAFARQIEQMQESLAAAQEQLEQLQNVATTQGMMLRRLLEMDPNEQIHEVQGWLSIQQRAIEQLQSRPDAPVAPDPLDYPHPTVFVASEGSTAKQWAERAMKNGATTSYTDGRTCTSDSDTSALVDLADSEFVMLETLDPNGGSRCTRYVKIAGRLGVYRAKTIGASDDTTQVVSVKMWDGTTLTGSAFNVRVNIPIATDTELFIAKVSPNTGATSSGSPVLWTELSRGVYTGPTTTGSNTEGSEGADTAAGGLRADDLWIHSRQAYFDAGDKKWYAYARKFRWNSRGQLYAFTGETRLIVDEPTSCASSFAGASDDNSELAYLMA